jgi:hypothetical protein
VEEDEVEVGLIEEVLVGLVVEVALEEDEEALLAAGGTVAIVKVRFCGCATTKAILTRAKQTGRGQRSRAAGVSDACSSA